MVNVRYSSRFKKDMKTCQKRGYDMNIMEETLETLRTPAALSEKNYDHMLTGNYIGYHECHLSSDWLLIYRYVNNELYLYRTGTHSDLFGK